MATPMDHIYEGKFLTPAAGGPSPHLIGATRLISSSKRRFLQTGPLKDFSGKRKNTRQVQKSENERDESDSDGRREQDNGTEMEGNTGETGTKSGREVTEISATQAARPVK